MPVLRIPTPLRAYTNGQSTVNVAGKNVSEVLTDLTNQYPTIKPHIFNEDGALRPFVNLFVGESNIKDLQGVETPIKEEDKVMLIPSIAGGNLKPFTAKSAKNAKKKIKLSDFRVLGGSKENKYAS